MILIIVNIFFTSILDDFSLSFAIAIYIRHIHHPGECIWKLPGTAVFIYVFSSFIQTIQSVLELHQIMRHALADFTAGRELHPALKNIYFHGYYSALCYIIQLFFIHFPQNILSKTLLHDLYQEVKSLSTNLFFINTDKIYVIFFYFIQTGGIKIIRRNLWNIPLLSFKILL